MNGFEQIRKVTPYRDINDVLCFLANGIREIFADDLVGFYLTGSLSYGDFDEGRSDIDLAAVLKKPATPEEMGLIENLHKSVGEKFPEWSNRLECSYIPESMLRNILPPEKPRPYYGAGVFYPEAEYGNEWIINQYFLYKSGIALIGPDFKSLTDPVDMNDVQEACVRDLHKEWEPKIADRKSLEDSHLESYIVLNLCRILYTVICADAVSKKVAAKWAREKYSQWSDLIGVAENWHYGIKLDREDETVEFIKFVINEVKGRKSYE